MTRMDDTTLAEQEEFKSFCDSRGVRCFIVGLFNYKGDIHSPLPVPTYACGHITRLDILSSGKVTLCCMDQEGRPLRDGIQQSSIPRYSPAVRPRPHLAMRAIFLADRGQHALARSYGECPEIWPTLLLRTQWANRRQSPSPAPCERIARRLR